MNKEPLDWLTLREGGERRLEQMESWTRRHRGLLYGIAALGTLAAGAILYPSLASRAAKSRPMVNTYEPPPHPRHDDLTPPNRARRHDRLGDDEVSPSLHRSPVPDRDGRKHRIPHETVPQPDEVIASSPARPQHVSLAPARQKPVLIWIHVGGAVQHPGAVHMTDGARVFEAVAAAGGVLPGADIDAINLAQKLHDETQILVPLKVVEGANNPGDCGRPSRSAEVDQGDRATVGHARVKLTRWEPGRRVDLNRASAGELEEIPGIGVGLARAILKERATGGPFRRVEDLQRVRRIGPHLVRQIRPYVDVGVGPVGGSTTRMGRRRPRQDERQKPPLEEVAP